MKYPAYPNYKDSGVEWLGEVPEHWGVKRLRHIARFKGGSTPSTNNSLFWDGGNIPWVSPKDMKVGLITQTQDYLTPEGAAECASGTLDPNQVLLVVRSGILRHTLPVAINQVPVTINQDIRAIKPYQYLRPEYVRWLIEGKQKALIEQWCKPGTTVESVEMAYLLATAIPIPSVTEQEAIIAFLNRETGRIDTLAAKKRRLIALLKEKRTALISRTVTRGLPADAVQEFGLTPHTRFKDSGIDWLGEVPAEWGTTPLKWLVRSSSGDGISSDDVSKEKCVEQEFPVIGGNGVMGYCSSFNTSEPSLVIGRVGALCGNVHEVYCPSWITDNALVLAVKESVFDLQYLAQVLRARNLNEIADKTAQPLITGTRVRAEVSPLPPKKEQTAIATYLDRETAKLDRLVEKIETAIARLQEYRTALITAAVTGKIDVRQAAGELAA